MEQLIIEYIKKYPNDKDLGEAIRKYYHKHFKK